jgi:hypothetical protein
MNEEKLARICWNANNWQYPSGISGKIADRSSAAYETKTGYGPEEWLFDVSRLVNGFHYAFIQAIGQHHKKYEGKCFNISFYTINSAKKERWWLGKIDNVHVISSEESETVRLAYKKNGWLKEMYEQLESVSADVGAFKKHIEENFCCIKFRQQDMHLLEDPRLFASDDPAVKSDYYNLKNKTVNPRGIETTGFQFMPGARTKKGETTAIYSKQTKCIDLVHNQIQDQIFEQLTKDYGKDNVACEQDTGLGTKVDIAVRSPDGCTFYELKTANTSKQCIREALAQLMEYAYYPGESRASRLIVVGLVDLSGDSKKYLENLRSKFSLPLYYRKFDRETKKLGSEE